MKLNLGCGKDIMDGYINIDTVDLHSGDKRLFPHDLRQPLPFDDNSAEEILALDILEHLPWWKVPEILKDWVRVLLPHKLLVIKTNDLTEIMRLMKSGEWSWEKGIRRIYSGEEGFYDMHRSAVDTEQLIKYASELNLKVAEKFIENGNVTMIFVKKI